MPDTPVKKTRQLHTGRYYSQLRILAAFNDSRGNQAEVARQLNVSRQRVQQVVAMAKLLNLI